ncbi:MAG: aldose 1-epimerase [Ilumatobacteraceae bacterium]
MITLTSPNGIGACIIDPTVGGRIESLVVGRSASSDGVDTELLVRRDSPVIDPADPFSWGCFTMVPFCGRVRNAEITFRGAHHHLERRFGPHAMHGTVVESPWIVHDLTPTSALLGRDLGPQWPFAGTVHHEITIEDRGLWMTLTLSAQEPMPAQVGWHPWFRRPTAYSLPFAAFLERDGEGIATTRRIEFSTPEYGCYDDCFVDVQGPISMRIDGVSLSLESDCSHWTVFDHKIHGICIEPQSGPPNGINESPEVLTSDGRLSRWFAINWDTDPSN